MGQPSRTELSPSPRPGPAGGPAAADVAESWCDGRAEASEQHAKALRRRQAAESRKARALIADFVEQAHARGVLPVRLRAWSYDGRARYLTPTHGWYLRRNQSVAVGTCLLYTSPSP